MLKSGIINTWVEDKIFVDRSRKDSSAYEKLTKKLNVQTKPILLDGKNMSSIKNYSPSIKNIIQSQIKDNQVIIIQDTNSPDAWWEIDPSSVQSLGMLSNGWGGAMQEYSQNLTQVAVKTMLAARKVKCVTAIGMITSMATFNHYGGFAVVDLAHAAGVGPCHALPDPALQAMCLYAFDAAKQAGGAIPPGGFNKATLMGICLT